MRRNAESGASEKQRAIMREVSARLPHGHVVDTDPEDPSQQLDDTRARRKLETEIMIAMAGLAAEYLHPGPVDRPGAVADLQRARNIALAATADPEEATAFINWLFVRARNRLRVPACARAIKGLEAELARRGSLTGAEVRALLRRSLD